MAEHTTALLDPGLTPGDGGEQENNPIHEVYGPHNLAPNPEGLYSLIDKTAEADYFALVAEWDTRAEALHASPEQTPTSTHEGLGLHFDRISLYHGSPAANITEFNTAEDDTVGEGLYATYTPDQAFGYATIRAKNRIKTGDKIAVTKTNPVAYELELDDITFLDLRNPEKTAAVMKDYAGYLDSWLTERMKDESADWMAKNYWGIVGKARDTILGDESSVPSYHLKEVLQQTGKLFSTFVAGNGFDGIVAIEGGEDGYTRQHESWVIIDPSKAKVTNEVSFLSPLVFDQETFMAQFEDHWK